MPQLAQHRGLVLLIVVSASSVRLALAGPPAAGEGAEWSPVDASIREETIERISKAIRSNYEAVRTWRGRYRFEEQYRVRGEIARRLGELRPEGWPAPEPPLRKQESGVLEFALDVERDSLWLTYDADGPPAILIDRTGEPLPLKDIGHSAHHAVVTPEHYLHIEPRRLFPPFDELKEVLTIPQNSGRVAFRDQPERWKRDAFVVGDPRDLFFAGQLPFWQELLRYAELLNGTTPEHEARRVRSGIEFLQAQDRLYQIRFKTTLGSPVQLVYDARRGYNVVAWSIRRADGAPRMELSWEYAEFDGIHVPVLFRRTKWRQDEPGFDFQRTLTLIESEFNRPIPADTFTWQQLGLVEGERIVDQVENAYYLYENGELRFLIGSSSGWGRWIFYGLQIPVVVLGVVLCRKWWRRRRTVPVVAAPA